MRLLESVLAAIAVSVTSTAIVLGLLELLMRLERWAS